jgi:hypothetical protein
MVCITAVGGSQTQASQIPTKWPIVMPAYI